MKFWNTGTTAIGCLLIIMTMVACGGSGSGSSVTFEISKSQVNFSSEENGATPSTQFVTGRIANVEENVFILVEHTNVGISSVEVSLTNTDSGRLSIYPRNPNELSVSTYTDSIKVFACYDQQCNKQVSGSPKVISVTHTVGPETNLISSSNSISFSAVEGLSSELKTISLSSTTDKMPTWSHQISYLTGNDWLTVNQDASNNTIDLSIVPSIEGNYSAILQINYSVDGRPKTIEVAVSYTATKMANISPNSLSFSSGEGELPAGQTIQVNFNVNAPPALLATATYTSGSNWLNITVDENSLLIQPNLLAVGNYQASINIQYPLGSLGMASVDIPVSYTINKMVSLSQPTLMIAAIEGAIPSSIPVSIEYTGSGNISWQTSIEYQTGDNWLSLDLASGDSLAANFSVSSGLLPVGTYTAVINVDYSYADVTSSLKLPVTYTVSSAWATSDNVNFVIDNSSTLDNLQITITIADAYTDSKDLNWTASISSLWVALDQNNGDTSTNDQLVLSLVSSEIEKLNNGEHYASLLLVADDVNVAPISIPVNLSLNLPVINYISPYVDYVGKVGADYKVIRGKGFTGLITNVMFGSEPAVSVDVISDTELHVTPPTLSAGSYDVFVENILALQLSQAKLVIKTAPNFSDFSSLTNIGIVERVVYDEEREVVFGAQCYFCTVGSGGTPATIYRFNYDNGWNMTNHSYPGLFDIAMTPDGKELLVLTSDQLLHVNPETMTTNSVVNLPFSVGGTALQMGVLNHGKVIFIGAQRTYSLLDNNFGSFSLTGRTVGIATSPDGSRAITGDTNNPDSNPLRYYDSSTNQWIVTGAGYYYLRGKLDQHGKRLFVSNRLFDENISILGELPAGFVSSGGTISYDGEKVYIHDLSAKQIKGSDISGLPPFVVSESIDIDDPGISRMVINQDGSFLFLVGEKRFVVKKLTP